MSTYGMKVAILGFKVFAKEVQPSKTTLTYQHQSKQTSERDQISENSTLLVENIEPVQLDTTGKIIEEGKLRIQIDDLYNV